MSRRDVLVRLGVGSLVGLLVAVGWIAHRTPQPAGAMSPRPPALELLARHDAEYRYGGLDVLCDRERGNLIYLAYGGDDGGQHVVVVEGGCAK